MSGGSGRGKTRALLRQLHEQLPLPLPVARNLGGLCADLLRHVSETSILVGNFLRESRLLLL
eukprot:10737364-Prorocentrum_lima.AAC.1